MKAIPWQSQHGSGHSDNKEEECGAHSLAAIPFPDCFQMRLYFWPSGRHQRGINVLCVQVSFKSKEIRRHISLLLLCQPYPNTMQPTDHIVSYSWQTTAGLSSTICTANVVWFGGSRGQRRISWSGAECSVQVPIAFQRPGKCWLLAVLLPRKVGPDDPCCPFQPDILWFYGIMQVMASSFKNPSLNTFSHCFFWFITFSHDHIA